MSDARRSAASGCTEKEGAVSPGDKRRRAAKRVRDQMRYAAALAALPPHARCGTCEYVDRVHTAPRLNCEVDNDGNGYAIVTADNRCPHWAPADYRLDINPKS